MTPEQQPPGDAGLAAVAPADAQQLDHDVQDRAGGERQEGNRDGLADPGLAEQRAEERRRAADEADQPEEAPARPLFATRERSDDAEALRGVVQPKTDDQDEREAQLPARRRLADREALGEVVQPDARGDQERQRLAGDSATGLTSVSSSAAEAAPTLRSPPRRRRLGHDRRSRRGSSGRRRSDREDRREADERSHVPSWSTRGVQRALDGLDRRPRARPRAGTARMPVAVALRSALERRAARCRRPPASRGRS